MIFDWFHRLVLDPQVLEAEMRERKLATAVTNDGRHSESDIPITVIPSQDQVGEVPCTCLATNTADHHHQGQDHDHDHEESPAERRRRLRRARRDLEATEKEGQIPAQGWARIPRAWDRCLFSIQRWLDDFNAPDGITKEHQRHVRFFGQVGFVAKGVVYGIIGGLTIATATHAPSPAGTENNASPQGAFILIGSADAVGIPLLIVMAVGLLFYIIWRFWEAITGQGADATFSSPKNFFKYRLSPFVSGCVYTAYLFYIIFVAIKNRAEDKDSDPSSGCFPSCWNTSTIGRIGLGFIGVAFLIATLTQLIPALTGAFRHELRLSRCKRWVRYLVRTAGHIGFLARAGVFLCVAVLVIRSISDDVDQDHFTVGASINQLATTSAGKFCLWLLGLGLIVYSLFAISNSYFKYFPTRPRFQPFPYDESRHQHNHFRYLRFHRHSPSCPNYRNVSSSPPCQDPCPECMASPVEEPVILATPDTPAKPTLGSRTPSPISMPISVHVHDKQ